ncbi:MAG: PAS domain-containing protein [Minisyncoccia bacterium]|jgi:PAS domain S-box-containing protein
MDNLIENPELKTQGFGEEECDMLFDMDLMGRITTVRFLNQELAKKLGYTEKDLVGQNVTDFLLDAKSVAGAEHFGWLYASEKAFRATDRKIKLKNGEIFTVESYLMPSYDPAGNLTGHRGMEFFRQQIVGPVA